MKNVLAVLAAVVGVGAYAAGKIDHETVYLERFTQLMSGGIPQGYDPMEPVPGALLPSSTGTDVCVWPLMKL